MRFSLTHKSLFAFIFAVFVILVWLCCFEPLPPVDGDLEICAELRINQQPCCTLNRLEPNTCALDNCARTRERALELGDRSRAGCYMCANHTLGVERCGLCYVMPQEDFYSAQHRDRTQCLLKSRNLTVSPNAVAIFRVRMYDAHESRLAATVITDSGALAGGGVTRHFSEAKAALRLTYGPARGILQHVVQDGDVVPDDFPLEPTCNLFDSRDPRVGNRRHACIDTYERGSVSCADESPTGIYYFWVQATDKGWSGAIVPSLHFSGSLGDAGYCHVTLGIALFASLPTSFIALAACACARLRWLVPEKQRDRREGQCLVFTVVAFIFAASPALYASFVIHQRLSLLW